jgi:hypothetical protein
MTLSYCIDRWTDERSPCDGSLEGWAHWLSRPDAEWGRDAPARDGDRFEAHVMRFEDDVVATRGPTGWSLDRPVAGADLVAVRWGEGLGWSEDNVVWGEDLDRALLDWLAENDASCEDVEHVAVARSQPRAILTFRAGPPPRLEADTVQ